MSANDKSKNYTDEMFHCPMSEQRVCIRLTRIGRVGSNAFSLTCKGPEGYPHKFKWHKCSHRYNDAERCLMVTLYSAIKEEIRTRKSLTRDQMTRAILTYIQFQKRLKEMASNDS